MHEIVLKTSLQNRKKKVIYDCATNAGALSHVHAQLLAIFFVHLNLPQEEVIAEQK